MKEQPATCVRRYETGQWVSCGTRHRFLAKAETHCRVLNQAEGKRVWRTVLTGQPKERVA